MNVILSLLIVVLSAIALFWRGRSGQSLSDAWVAGLGLLVHGVIVLLVVALLGGCSEQPSQNEQARVQAPTPADHHQGYHRIDYDP
jgi:hypothetical protein